MAAGGRPHRSLADRLLAVLQREGPLTVFNAWDHVGSVRLPKLRGAFAELARRGDAHEDRGVYSATPKPARTSSLAEAVLQRCGLSANTGAGATALRLYRETIQALQDQRAVRTYIDAVDAADQEVVRALGSPDPAIRLSALSRAGVALHKLLPAAGMPSCVRTAAEGVRSSIVDAIGLVADLHFLVDRKDPEKLEKGLRWLHKGRLVGLRLALELAAATDIEARRSRPTPRPNAATIFGPSVTIHFLEGEVRRPGVGRPQDVAAQRAMLGLAAASCSDDPPYFDPAEALAALLIVSGEKRQGFSSLRKSLCVTWKRFLADHSENESSPENS